MLGNHHLAKSISDAGWYGLTQMVEYKADWYGRTFERVSARHTSQDCSACGYRNAELTLSVREWVCPSCGSAHDRDVNAAKNIKSRAVGHTVTQLVELDSTGPPVRFDVEARISRALAGGVSIR